MDPDEDELLGGPGGQLFELEEGEGGEGGEGGEDGGAMAAKARAVSVQVGAGVGRKVGEVAQAGAGSVGGRVGGTGSGRLVLGGSERTLLHVACCMCVQGTAGPGHGVAHLRLRARHSTGIASGPWWVLWLLCAVLVLVPQRVIQALSPHPRAPGGVPVCAGDRGAVVGGRGGRPGGGGGAGREGVSSRTGGQAGGGGLHACVRRP